MGSGIIFNIQRFSINDGNGIRTLVFLKGCPLHCRWCHNPEGINHLIEELSLDVVGSKITSKQLLTLLNKDIDYYKISKGGVTFSGGEPLLQPLFINEVSNMCKQNGISLAIETCGFVSRQSLDIGLEYIDTVLYDVKTFDESVMKNFIGGNVNTIIENLYYINDLNKEIILRCPIIPNINFNEEHFIKIAKLANQLKNVKEVNFLRYHKLGKSKYNKYGLKFHNFGEVDIKKLKDMIETFKKYCSKGVTYE